MLDANESPSLCVVGGFYRFACSEMLVLSWIQQKRVLFHFFIPLPIKNLKTSSNQPSPLKSINTSSPCEFIKIETQNNKCQNSWKEISSTGSERVWWKDIEQAQGIKGDRVHGQDVWELY